LQEQLWLQLGGTTGTITGGPIGTAQTTFTVTTATPSQLSAGTAYTVTIVSKAGGSFVSSSFTAT